MGFLEDQTIEHHRAAHHEKMNAACRCKANPSRHRREHYKKLRDPNRWVDTHGFE